MVAIVITMCVRPEKDQELLVTLHELESLNRQATGYMGTTVHRDPEEKQIIMLFEQWQTRKDLEHYMQSHAFEVLRGAMKVLTSSAEIEIIAGNNAPELQSIATDHVRPGMGQHPMHTPPVNGLVDSNGDGHDGDYRLHLMDPETPKDDLDEEFERF